MNWFQVFALGVLFGYFGIPWILRKLRKKAVESSKAVAKSATEEIKDRAKRVGGKLMDWMNSKGGEK